MTTKRTLSKIKKAVLRPKWWKPKQEIPSYERKRANRCVRTALGIALHYSKHLGISLEEALDAMENARTYSALSYYQKANFPRLDGLDVYVFNTQEELQAACPSKTFVCPACKGISTDATTCNSMMMTNGKLCDWKSYGLFGCLGKGFSFIVKERIAENGLRVHTTFTPFELWRGEYKIWDGTKVSHLSK